MRGAAKEEDWTVSGVIETHTLSIVQYVWYAPLWHCAIDASSSVLHSCARHASVRQAGWAGAQNYPHGDHSSEPTRIGKMCPNLASSRGRESRRCARDE